MRHHGRAGLRLLAAGSALVALYAVLVWIVVFDHQDAEEVCGRAVPHRDNFFPPYTTCGSGRNGYSATSALQTYTGAALFIVGAALLVAGAAVVIRDVVRARGRTSIREAPTKTAGSDVWSS